MRYVIVAVLLSILSTPVFAGLSDPRTDAGIQQGCTLMLPKGTELTVPGALSTEKKAQTVNEGTTIRVRWDDTALTVMFDCVDSAIADAEATTRDNNKTWKDDSVAIYLDIGHTHQEWTLGMGRTIAIKLSAGGGLFDRLNNDDKVNIEGLDGKVERIDTGWRATIIIPFKGLGVVPAPGEVWGVNFARIDHEGKTYANMKNLSWVPTPTHAEDMSAWGHLIFAAPGAKDDDAATHAALKTIQTTHDGLLAPLADHILFVPEKGSAMATGFVKRLSNAPMTQSTEARLSWDKDALRVTFVCADTSIIGEHTTADDVKTWKDDNVAVYLDPGHTHNADGHHIFLQASVTGAIHDGRDGDPKINVDGAKATVTKNDAEWTCELVVPWKGLGMTPASGDVWGIALFRFDNTKPFSYDTTEYGSWTPLGKAEFNQPDRWGHIVFAAAGAKADDTTVKAAGAAISARHAERVNAIHAASNVPDPAQVQAKALGRKPLSRTLAKLSAGHAVTVVCFGDSISEIGCAARWNVGWCGGASKPEKNWGGLVVASLRAAYPKSTITLIHQGIGGQNTAEGLNRFADVAKAKSDLILVEFGSNDCGFHVIKPEESAAALDTILSRIGGELDADAVLVGFESGPLTKNHATETQAAMVATARKYGVPYADVAAALDAAVKQGKALVSLHVSEKDGHPNDAGHAVWADAVKTAIAPLLADRKP